MSYGGKSVNSHDMRRACVCSWVWFMGVCTSRADEMKNGGRLKYMCQQNAYPNNKEGYMCSSPHVSLTRPRLSPSLADAPCTMSHGSDVLL